MLTMTDSEFRKFAGYIKQNFGIFLKEEKKTLLIGRLQNLVLSKNIGSFSEYFDYVTSDKTGEAAITLINKITTNHTFFMRESQHFYYFRDIVLPYLKGHIKDKDLRIWCGACSSGEESYTLAMIIDEFFGKEKSLWDTKILATDISEGILNVARKGIYTSERVEPLPKHWKLNYFKKLDEDSYLVNEKIMNEVIYRKFNLMGKVFPFKKKFHVIFCRNVMIYFDKATKAELLERFYDSLEWGGYFFVGLSESITNDASGFKYVAPSVYRKE